jgi:hypothetical protein
MSKRLVLLVCIVMTLGIVLTPAVFADIIIMATQSCRTSVVEPDTNNHNSSKLSIRSDQKSAKSWIKFEIGNLDVGELETATLTVALHDPKDGSRHFDVSNVNDDCLDNIDWDERNLTWNNAPGNNMADFGGLDASKTTLLTTVNFTDGVPGDSFTIDILEALQADTDGIIQFVCHNSNGLLNLATHDHAEEAWRPFIVATEGAKYKAKKSHPAHEATDVIPTPILSWTPGEYVEGLSPMHKVFFSEDFNDVNDGIGGVTQDANEYPAPGSPLDFGKTYYWRVDEANSVSEWDQGDVWEFTTEPIGYPIPGENITVTASSMNSSDTDPDNTINGSGLDADDRHTTETGDMWLSNSSAPGEAWIQYSFDRPQKLHQMLVWNYNGESMLSWNGIKEVAVEYSEDGEAWRLLDNFSELAQAPGTDDCVPEILDLSGLTAKHLRITAHGNWSPSGILTQYGLSEVRFIYIPVSARKPSPDSGAADVDPEVTLTWRAGREATAHNLYLSTNDQTVIDGTAPVVSVTDASYSASALDLGSTYYWRVDEVNEAETTTIWQGDVWDFTTQQFIVVDGFEDYNDYPPDEIYSTWLDGYENPTNGSQVGYLTPPAVEMTTVHSGRQSMPLIYSNTGAATYSEAARTFAVPQDWTEYGIQTLQLWYYGTAGNTGQLYVKINGVKVPYGDTANLAVADWLPWDIDLMTVGVNLQSVTSLAIGIDGNAAAGTLYVDDIRLYGAQAEIP